MHVYDMHAFSFLYVVKGIFIKVRISILMKKLILIFVCMNEKRPPPWKKKTNFLLFPAQSIEHNRTEFQSNSIFLPLMKINMSSHTDTYFKEQNRQEEALHFVLVNLYSKVGNLCQQDNGMSLTSLTSFGSHKSTVS